jgi:putative transcriptional regulator
MGTFSSGVAPPSSVLDAVSVQKSLAPGFLIAMPQLGDPNFHRSVVLMIEHSDSGAMGLVINHTAQLTLKDLASSQKLKLAERRLTDPVFVGGPVEPQKGFVLHDSTAVEERHQILPGLFLSVTVDSLQPLLIDSGAKVRFCLGYAGWGPRQIEQELAHGSWVFTDATPSSVLELAPDALWDATLRSMGIDPFTLIPGRGLH